MKSFDIIIAGGGMAGATAAIALAKLNLNIALVEPIKPELEASPSFDQRAVALSAASVSIFNTLGIWSRIQELGCPITDIHVSDQGSFGFARIKASDYKVDALGQVIPLDQTGPLLWQIIKEIKNIELICPASITKINTLEDQKKKDSVVVTLEKGTLEDKTLDDNPQEKQLSAKLLLAADGTFSSIANLSSIQTTRTPYDQHAVITNISTEHLHKNRAFERFTKNGPLALLPLTQNRMSLVWCQREANLKSVMNYDDNQFIEKLQQEFGYRLGQITKVGKRTHYPLSLHLPTNIFNGRVLLLGNAAHTLHPIAGQGFNIGLRDIAALFDAVQMTIKDGIDFGGQSFLTNYQEQRKPDRDLTITATDMLARLFSNDFLPLIIARNKGLSLLNKFPFAKKQLAMAAMGFHGESAQLTRGVELNN